MRVHVSQSGHGKPIIFLHGIGSSGASWAAVTDLLSDRYFLSSIDLMGHGDSPAPADPAEYSRDKALEDIDAVIETLHEAPILVGSSLGGYLALAHAATRIGSAAGIVVLNTGPGFRNVDKRNAWNERSKRNAHRFGVIPQAGELNLQHDSVVMDRLAELEVPTLVLAGSLDREEYASAGRYMADKMKNCRFEPIEGGAHDMHEETHAREIAKLIDDFAKSVASRT